MEPVTLEPGAFMQRWKSLEGNDRECQEVVKAPPNAPSIDEEYMKRITNIITSVEIRSFLRLRSNTMDSFWCRNLPNIGKGCQLSTVIISTLAAWCVYNSGAYALPSTPKANAENPLLIYILISKVSRQHGIRSHTQIWNIGNFF
jgi:Alpha adaptin AP2, C-terminal domain